MAASGRAPCPSAAVTSLEPRGRPGAAGRGAAGGSVQGAPAPPQALRPAPEPPSNLPPPPLPYSPLFPRPNPRPRGRGRGAASSPPLARPGPCASAGNDPPSARTPAPSLLPVVWVWRLFALAAGSEIKTWTWPRRACPGPVPIVKRSPNGEGGSGAEESLVTFSSHGSRPGDPGPWLGRRGGRGGMGLLRTFPGIRGAIWPVSSGSKALGVRAQRRGWKFQAAGTGKRSKWERSHDTGLSRRPP
ncbi:uncharacterized protein LOC114220916 [Eumetopias jubatus]|uniref:uncharacterized protein LOC114220916 n=1 Tax=Eumetopias jubatus TaxID=34886 RepID=UPI00101634AF|nr:uncharacterized protein LOC114220916 [Eumetopias jubatus]